MTEHEPCPVCGANEWLQKTSWGYTCLECRTEIDLNRINDRVIRWVRASERLPEAKKTVYAEVQYKHHEEFVAICYIPPRTILAEDFLWDYSDDLTDYDEESDRHWVLGGWFETSFEQEMNYAISGTVIRWLEDKTGVSE